MKFFKKLILGSFVSLFVSLLICAFYFKGAIILTLDIISNLKSSNKSIETLAEIKDYYALESMDIKNLNYKNCDNSFIDIFFSNLDTSSSSVIIYLHGGAWVYGNNAIPIGMEPVLKSFNDKGYTIISLSYELLSDNTDISKPIADVKDLVRWIYKNKEVYNFNTEDIGILGISSGAHLGMMAAYSNEEDFIGDLELSTYPSKVNYVIDVFGPSELNILDFNILNNYSIFSEKISLNNINSINLINNIYSPLYYIDKNTPRTLIIHSKEDTLVPYEGSLKLFNKLKENNIKTTFVSLNRGTHDFENLKNYEIALMTFELLKFLVYNSNL